MEAVSAFALQGNVFSNLHVKRVLLFHETSFTSSTPSVVALNHFTNIVGEDKGVALHYSTSSNALVSQNLFSNISFPSLTGTEEAAGVYIDQTSSNVLLEHNSFTGCIASVGGAVSFKNGFVHFALNSYSQNGGFIYGTDIAAFPVRMEIRPYDLLPPLYKENNPRHLGQDRRRLLDLETVQSGGTISDFYLVLLDQYDRVVESSNGHVLSIAIESVGTSTQLPKYETLVDLTEIKGVYDITGVVFSGRPGSSATITFASPTINPSLFGSNSSYGFEVGVTFRGCLSGEEFTDDGRCI